MIVELRQLKLNCPHCPRKQCEGSIQPWRDIPDDDPGGKTPITGCPWATLPLELMEWFRWYGYWQKGWLPVDGGVLNQSVKFLDVMDYLDMLFAKQEARNDAHGRRAFHPPQVS